MEFVAHDGLPLGLFDNCEYPLYQPVSVVVNWLLVFNWLVPWKLNAYCSFVIRLLFRKFCSKKIVSPPFDILLKCTVEVRDFHFQWVARNSASRSCYLKICAIQID